MSKGRHLLSGCMMITLAVMLTHCGRRDHDARSSQLKIIDTISLGKNIIGISVVRSRLNVPWEMLWGPDHMIWFTDQDGAVIRLDPVNGEMDTVLTLPQFYRKRLALASMVFHSHIKNQPYAFFNHLFLKDSIIYTRIVRYTYRSEASNLLSDPKILLEYPGHAGHNGSRMALSPDGKLMIATGDAFIEKNAQDTGSVSGKILRLNIDGSIPADNPIPGNAMWSMGFRVPQGLVYSSTGHLYSAEHGDATDDEINLIQRGGNYGYPYVTGNCDSAGEHTFCELHNVVAPLKAWTPTIAPAGIDYYGDSKIGSWTNSLLVTTLKDQSLRILKLSDDGRAVVDEQVVLSGKFGRFRDVCVSPAGDIYLSTSNRDWNPPAGFPLSEDDRIIRLSLTHDKELLNFVRDSSLDRVQKMAVPDSLLPGSQTYMTYCASCHKPDGKGVEGSFPSLRDASILYGPSKNLISMVLYGSESRSTGEHKLDQRMPGFAFLGDGAIADVLHYIRKQFGNSGERVRPEDVQKWRKH